MICMNALLRESIRQARLRIPSPTTGNHCSRIDGNRQCRTSQVSNGRVDASIGCIGDGQPPSADASVADLWVMNRNVQCVLTAAVAFRVRNLAKTNEIGRPC